MIPVDPVLGDALALEAESILADLGEVGASRPPPRTKLNRELDAAPVVFAGTDPPPLSIQRATANSKLAPQRVEIARSGRKRFVPSGPFAVSTYASTDATCPDSCRFKGGGCYAEAGAGHLTMNRLNRRAPRWSPLEVTFAEAEALGRLWPYGVPQDGYRGGRDMRLHVAGDVSCRRGAVALGVEAGRWRERGGGAVWTYTHRWPEIRRSAFGPISVLASVETEREVALARAQGYAPAVTVARFPGRRFKFGGADIIACPYEAGASVTCVTCRLCLDRDLFTRRQGIGFQVHGRDADTARAKLPVLRS